MALDDMTILFIDDDSDDTELFCEAVNYLASSDFLARMPEPIKCVSCNHSYTAVELLKNLEELPAYIFLDINMPVMDGKECLIKLKSDRSQIYQHPLVPSRKQRPLPDVPVR